MSSQMTIPKDQNNCTVEESIKESFKQIKEMQEGKRKKNTLDDLWKNIAEWSKDDIYGVNLNKSL